MGLLMTLTVLISVSLVAALAAVLIVMLLGSMRGYPTHVTPEPQRDIVILFRDGALLDATPDALDVLGQDISQLSDVVDVLEATFPTLPDLLQEPVLQDDQLESVGEPAVQLDIKVNQGTLKLTLSGETEGWHPPLHQKSLRRAALMQDVAQLSPQLVWQETLDGQVIWSNAAYQDLIGSAAPFKDLNRSVDGEPQVSQRVTFDGNSERWFDVTTAVHNTTLLHFATDATALVRADQDRRDFVQTLGKTFADLSIGLAIFDKGRQLAMFNPALFDMTKLPVPFLSARPSIDTFLDRLRELQIIPEPKNYGSWRDKFLAVEEAAKDGTYSENWALADGQTFRVTGRPHPDGAFAILFEDITAEVSLTRRFRADIETSQAVLDTLPDAIAVFSGNGTMVISNASYAKLWSTDTALMMDHRDIKSEIGTWQDHCIASPMWTQMRDFIQLMGARKPWSDNAMLEDGRHLRCHAMPIAGGMTMVRFVIAPPMRPVIQKLTQIDPAIIASKA